MNTVLKRAAVAALLAFGICPSYATAQAWGPLAAIGEGVWEAPGYGWILDLDSDVPRLFHRAGPYCYTAPPGQLGEDESFALARIEGAGLVLSAAAGTTQYAYRRINALPAACTQADDWDRKTIAALVGATFADLYAGFGPRERSAARLSARLSAADNAANDTAAFDVIARALGDLDDGHVGLTGELDDGEHSFESGDAPSLIAAKADSTLGDDEAGRLRAWSVRYREGIISLLADRGHLVANRRILWGRIGSVGYLNVLTMGGFAEGDDAAERATLDAALDEAISGFAGARAVIVDVSNNRGGYDWVSLQIAGRFAVGRHAAFSKQAKGDVPQEFMVEPSPSPRFTGPVALVTSDVTVSAGEVFTLAMRALPNVSHWGTATRGALSDQLAKPLPNGWELTFPAETYRDPSGLAPEGIGIAPQHAWPMAGGANHAERIAWLAARLADN